MDTYHLSLAHEIARCREKLHISQVRLARLVNLKTHRLSDLEKARSTPTQAEEERGRQQLRHIMRESVSLGLALPPLRDDPRLSTLIRHGAGR